MSEQREERYSMGIFKNQSLKLWGKCQTNAMPTLTINKNYTIYFY